MENDELPYKEYKDWIKKEGAIIDKTILKVFYNDYRGLIANEDIKKGEEILYIPKSAIITLKMAKEGYIGKQLEYNDASFVYPNNSTLSTFVLWEMAKPDSPWHLLIKAFPKSVANFPIFFEKDELKLLTGSYFLKTIEELKDDIKYDYDETCRCAPEFSNVATLINFAHIRMLVNSRIFGTTINGQENDTIVPYADMFNFKPKTTMTNWLYEDKREGFIVKANKDIRKNEEIYVSYGDKPNTNMFQFYGFVLENNELDETIIEMTFDDSDPLNELKKSLIDKEGKPKKIKFMSTTKSAKFNKAISLMRFGAFNRSETVLRNVFYY